MSFKHQASCYRNIGGIKYMNACDLIMGDIENGQVESEVRADAHAKGKKVKKIKHHTGEYYQLFVEN